MKASKKNAIRSLLAASILALSMVVPASAGNTASGTIRLGVVLVSTVQAEARPAMQAAQFSMGSGASLQIDPSNARVNGQMREIEMLIDQKPAKTGKTVSPAFPFISPSTPQARAKLVQTTFVAD